MSEFVQHPVHTKFKVSRDGQVLGMRGRMLRGGSNGKYRTVTELVLGVQRNHYIHRLVAEIYVPTQITYPM